MIFGEGPIIKNIAGDLNKLFLQGSRVGQPITNVEGDAAADQGTIALMADRDPVIRDISTGLGYETPPGREVTVSGTGALQLVNSLGRLLKSWSAELAPYQEGTGDPSPSNVRPIHGTDKINIVTSGANLFDKTAITPNTWITVNSTTTSYAAGYSVSDYIPVVKGASYWMMPKGSTRCAYYDKNKNGIAYFDTDGSSTSYFVPLYDGYVRLTISAQTSLDTYMFAVLPLGSDYVPYTAPSTTVITLPQTVYTGTIGSEGGDSIDGAVDLGSLNWIYNSQNNTFYALVSDKAYGGQNKIMCEQYKPSITTGFNLSDYEISVGSANSYIYVKDPRYTIASDFKTAVSGVKLVYPLAITAEFAVTAPDIPTPSGDATAWAVAEDGTVTNFSVTYIQSE